MNCKQKPGELVVFVYDHFYPDYSAGGPVTSLVNLSQAIKEKVPCWVLTSAYVYSTREKIANIEVDKWVNWKELSIWYAGSWQGVKKGLLNLPRSKDTKLYLNGIFSPVYFLYPLWLANRFGYSVVISPRGMLQSGALGLGRFKKRMFLTCLKLSGLLNGASYHATDLQEASDIKKAFGPHSNVAVIPNFPTTPTDNVVKIEKIPGELHLVYYSLVSEKKNLLFLLQLLEGDELLNLKIDIIGPIKDRPYWERCQNLIRPLTQRGTVRYLGEISPEKSRKLLPSYHVLVLPTLGENFGHAIVEMLACSRPVLISDKTPWTDLELSGAGYSLPLTQKIWIEKLLTMVNWDQEAFDKSCTSALEYYWKNFDFKELESKYLRLFLTETKNDYTGN